MDPRSVIIRPVISEKAYALIAAGKYTFRVDDRAHKFEIKDAVEKAMERARKALEKNEHESSEEIAALQAIIAKSTAQLKVRSRYRK